MHVTNNKFSDKFNNDLEKKQNVRFIVIFRILRQKFDLVAAVMTSSIIMAAGYCRVCSCLHLILQIMK